MLNSLEMASHMGRRILRRGLGIAYSLRLRIRTIMWSGRRCARIFSRRTAIPSGRGPDHCIDAVDCRGSCTGSLDAVMDKVKFRVMLGTERAHAVRQAILCCRTAETISVLGAYVGFPDKLPLGPS